MQNPKITIITVNWWAKDFADVLFRSILDNTKCEHEIIAVDNSGDLDTSYFVHFSQMPIVKQIKPEVNLGHGKGLDMAIKEAKGEYILILDVDAHILLKNWDEKLLKYLEGTHIKLACASDGGLLKPARPLAMFFKKETIVKNRISFKAKNLDGVKFDVGIHAYFRILTEYGDKSILRLNSRETKYVGVLGNEYCLGAESFVYHNWYGTRFFNGRGIISKDKVDAITFKEFDEKKKNLFKQI